MIPTRKTDSFINQLGNIVYYIDLYIDSEEIGNYDVFDWAFEQSAFLNIYESYLILTEHLGDKNANYKKTDDDDINVIIINDYLFSDYIEYTDNPPYDMVEIFRTGNYIIKNDLIKKLFEEKKKIYKKVNEIEHVSLKDIHDEFWALYTDVEHILPLLSIIESLNFKRLNEINFKDSSRVIFEDGSSKDLSIFLDEFKINYPPIIEKEFKHYLKEIILGLTDLVFNIKDMFDTFLSMTEEDVQEIEIDKTNNRIILKYIQNNNIETLHRNLIENKYISQDSDFESFKSIFHGYSTSNFAPIKWLSNKQLLRELLTSLKYNDINIAEMQRLTPTLFIDKQNKPLDLAKNKHLETRESRQIQTFLRLCE